MILVVALTIAHAARDETPLLGSDGIASGWVNVDDVAGMGSDIHSRGNAESQPAAAPLAGARTGVRSRRRSDSPQSSRSRCGRDVDRGAASIVVRKRHTATRDVPANSEELQYMADPDFFNRRDAEHWRD